MSCAFNNVKEESRCHGSFHLYETKLSRLLQKYTSPKGKYRFKDCLVGKYFVFKTPDNMLYIISELEFESMFVTMSNSNTGPKDIDVDDTFTINSPHYKGIVQFKKMIIGEYYVFESSEGKLHIISGVDIDCLSESEKKTLLC